MKLKWHKSDSAKEPEEVMIAKTTVFVRKNIEEKERETEEGTESYFEYDEATMTKAEYAQYLAEMNRADIDYICMEVGVEL